MRREDIIQAIRQSCARFSAKDLEGYLDLYSPCVVLNGFGNVQMGVAGLRQHFSKVLAGFPDMRIESHNIFGENDRFAHQFSFCGTHKGLYMGVPPTNEFVYSPAVMIHLFEDGKCVEASLYVDRSRFLAIQERFLGKDLTGDSTRGYPYE
jgi:predicted ester cyclase